MSSIVVQNNLKEIGRKLSEIGRERGRVSDFEVNTLLARVTVYGWSLIGRGINNRHIYTY